MDTEAVSELNISDAGFWAKPAAERAEMFAQLRAQEPVSHQRASNLGIAPSGNGYWAVSRHADILHVSRNPELFCSGQGVGLSDIPPELMELNASFLMMDAPRHTKLRKVVSGAFTPRKIARLEAEITAEATRIVDEFVERGSGEFVSEISMKLPLWTISRMMGIPPSMQGEFYQAAEAQVSSQDPEFGDGKADAANAALEAAMTLHRLAAELAALRRSRPGDDIWSTLVASELDGEPLGDQLLGGIFVLFAVAGNDTTRNSTSHGIKAFADNPAQWALLARDRSVLETAVEEIVRWATPVIHFRRTTTVDTELAGVRIPAGQPVVMFYESGNRDDSAFADPYRFDITRDPNPHVGFGGGGVHFCLGANLARAQLRAIFSRLADRVSEIDVGEPAHLISNFVNGIKRLPVTVTPSQLGG